MLAPKKNISSSLHDVRPPSAFKPKRPTASFTSTVLSTSALQNNPANFEMRAQRIAVQAKANLLEEVTIRPRDPTSYLPSFKRHSKTPRNVPKKRNIWSRLRSLLLITAGLSVLLYGLSLYNMRDSTLGALRSIQDNLKNAISAFKNLQTDKAAVSLKGAEKSFETLSGELKQHGLLGIGALLGTVFPVAENASQAFKGVKSAITGALELNNDVAKLQKSSLSYFMNGRGDELTALLRSIRDHLKQVMASGEALQRLGDSLSNSIFSRYLNWGDAGGDLAYFKEGYAAQGFLDTLITSLTREEPMNLLLLFQNSSEMRPSGGFIGSYAVLTIKDGALNNLDVRDIYDPDGWVEKKIIPPKPLQITTTDWEARDANWFADFRLSAAKVIQRLEDSLFYKEKNVTFAGAIAVNINVVADLLAFTGPISLPEYDLVITKQNFLEKVQYEVEAGRNKSKNQPKKILSDITPKILDRLAALNVEQKNLLMEALLAHLAAKDIQIYFTEKPLEQFMEKYGIAGALFEAPKNWSGDYLAVVNANVAAGKTDAYIDERIIVKSALDISGKATNAVTVERSHKGGNTAYSWYNITNKNYLRILTPLGTDLTDLQGETERVMSSGSNYNGSKYVTDPDIKLLEREGQESGKNVFAAWRYTNPGKTSAVTFKYERTLAIELKDGATYQFVFDKQSGVVGGISYTLEAPPGFKWKQSGSSIFEYKNDDPPARVVVDLTLEKI